MHSLSAVHKVSGLSAQAVRIASVTAVASGRKGADGWIEANIDFDEVKRQAEHTFPVGSGILLFDLTLVVEDDNRQLKWVFPPTTAPTGEARVSEGDP
jgi:hypothetical protein